MGIKMMFSSGSVVGLGVGVWVIVGDGVTVTDGVLVGVGEGVTGVLVGVEVGE